MNERPVLLQGSEHPIFRGEGNEPFSCKSCGHVLVEGHEPRKLIGVDIECAKCGAISTTQLWDEREPLPASLVTLGSSGRFLIKGTVDMVGKAAAISCDEEIARVQANKCQPPPHDGLDISPDMLAAVTQEVDLWTNGAFSDALSSARRARASGNELFTRCPLAWAVDRVTEALRGGAIDIDGHDAAALLYLEQWRHFSVRWKHHPLFKEVIAPALCNEYHHTIALLVCCTYLEEHGNSIGITFTPGEVGKSPDLYINASPNQRVSIEIKAPDALHWPKPLPNQAEIERRVEEQLKAAAKQLTGNAGGVVVIGTNHVDPNLAGRVRAAIESLAARGRISSKITIISSVCAHGTITRVDERNVKPEIEWNVSVTRNPKFNGESFIKTEL